VREGEGREGRGGRARWRKGKGGEEGGSLPRCRGQPSVQLLIVLHTSFFSVRIVLYTLYCTRGYFNVLYCICAYCCCTQIKLPVAVDDVVHPLIVCRHCPLHTVLYTLYCTVLFCAQDQAPHCGGGRGAQRSRSWSCSAGTPTLSSSSTPSGQSSSSPSWSECLPVPILTVMDF